MTQPKLTTLATFATAGTHPYGVLVSDAAGNLYGTTYNGGTADRGTVFELAKGASTVTTLVNFTGDNGGNPVAGLTIDAAGNLFGATAYGGSANRGTLFELAKGATAVTTLTTFIDTNGAVPQSLLTLDAAGNLFGTTNESGGGGVGTVFEWVKGATDVTTLATLNGYDGAYAEGGVAMDADGNLYGTTVYGGSGPGTIFELAKGASAVTTLAQFTGPDGAVGRSGLIADAAGNFYGTTYGGGSANLGTVYELAKGTHAVTTLATFTGPNGQNPDANLIIDAAGNLYGTTFSGGSAGGGTVFKLLKGAGVVTTLANFDATKGGNPYAGLLIDAAGNLFGTTTSGAGTVFELPVPSSAPPLNVVTTSPDTTALLATINAAVGQLPDADVVHSNGGAIPAAPAAGSALLLSISASGPVSIPTGYAYVELESGSNVNLSGGDASAMVIGDGFTYSGVAAWVGSGAGVSQISDNAAGATILVGSSGSATVTAAGAHASVAVGDGGTSTVTLSGAGAAFGTGSNSSFELSASGGFQTLTFGNGSLGDAIIAGTGNTINVGGSAVAAAGNPGAAGVTHAKIQDLAGSANTYNLTDASAMSLIALGASDTVNASAGVSTIFGSSADVVNASLGSVFFVGGAGPSTVTGGSANTTLFATAGDRFDLGSAQANVFVGGTAASTVNAGAGAGSFFGGTHGDQYNFGTSQSQVFVGLGGADTLGGAAGTVAPEIFATGAETMTLTGSTPVTVVALTSGGVIDGSGTGGNNIFFAGYGMGGNQTLVGSATQVDPAGAATHDVFVAGANPAATATSITIENWHGGDVFYLTGFTAADTATMDAAVGNSLGQGSAGDLSFTLADNTRITFLGSHPTNFDAPSNAAF